jgi:oxygen-independent coproporphyrinogen-3 oxidase
MQTDVLFDAVLIERYDRTGPRYTSYPTALQFREDFTQDAYRELAARSNENAGPLSLYLHIPFCDTVCFYCACNKVITRNRGRSSEYLRWLHREIAMQGGLFNRARPVRQLHWGGGTPTFISPDEMAELMAVTGEHFHLLDDDTGEYSIEVDPRSVDAAAVHRLRRIGFNRLSLGVQDFDPAVQRAVNRIQPRERTSAVLEAAREAEFRSVSVDLIYGLPRQTVASFTRTLDQVIELAPDRLSVFNYAHLPHIFKSQRRINEAELPSPEMKLAILRNVVEHLSAAGYHYIGMDHFALPDDELAKAQREGTLYRNFQGYSTHSDCDLVALGATSIGRVGPSYNQNERDLKAYAANVASGNLPLFRGVMLSADDLLRRDVINALICNLAIDKAAVAARHGISFDDYFSDELKELESMQADGLMHCSDQAIVVRPPGRLLIRNICMVFDAYLRGTEAQRFSKVI